MKKIYYITVIILFFNFIGCQITETPNDDFNNENEEQNREKWSFFNFHNLYVDEMIFNTTIPEQFWGNWGTHSYYTGAYKSGYSFPGYFQDFSSEKIVMKNIESERNVYNTIITLTDNKLIFNYYYGYTRNIDDLYSDYWIIDEKKINFNLIALKKIISEAPDWDDKNDYYENLNYYFLSDDEKYGFILEIYGQNIFNENYVATLSTNRIYIDPNIFSENVPHFVSFFVDKIE
jgi:hypothetical protein